MKITGVHKFSYSLFITFFLCISTFYGVALTQAYREYKVFRSHELKLKSDLAHSQQQLQSQEWYLNRFLNDPYFLSEWFAKGLVMPTLTMLSLDLKITPN